MQYLDRIQKGTLPFERRRLRNKLTSLITSFIAQNIWTSKTNRLYPELQSKKSCAFLPEILGQRRL